MAGAQKINNGKFSLPTPLLAAYAVFAGCAFALYHLVMDDAPSAVMTVANMLQCLSVALLAGQVLSSGSVVGISSRGVGLHALGLVCRLSSTTWLQGYLPVDDSGDWFFQTVDFCALSMLLWILYKMHFEQSTPYDHAADSFPVAPVVCCAIVLATIFHADMNLRPVFDTLWMTGLFLSTTAVLPQLWLINQTGGRVEALTSHHIAVMALGTMLAGVFMFAARNDIVCKPWIEDVNHSILAILAAHFLHLLLLCDFAYYYLKAVATQGLVCTLEVEGVANFV
eukprot:TRINITY_DN723_c0_g2_i1.p1 TRINITY_DN723_c0_g2~~TRINITY_DN723_c0_g2_i1.p1  ORF type:complete len:282 (-),score=40.79 TRINITY_DN723_c0_g2_i1:95-940(-)